MSIYERTRKGSLTLVDTKRIHRFGALFVSESRFKHMAKWLNGIITQAIANPLLYLLSVGVESALLLMQIKDRAALMASLI